MAAVKFYPVIFTLFLWHVNVSTVTLLTLILSKGWSHFESNLQFMIHLPKKTVYNHLPSFWWIKILAFVCKFPGAILWRYRNQSWRGLQALCLLWPRLLCRETGIWSIVRLSESQFVLRLSGGWASGGNINFGRYHGYILCSHDRLYCDIWFFWRCVYHNTQCSPYYVR